MKDSIIRVTGTAAESTPPDQTELSLTLSIRNKDYSAMMSEASEKAEALTSALTAAGFDKSDIKTAEFNISSDYENVQTENGSWKRQFSGYRLVNRLHLVFPYDMKRLNDAVNAATGCKDADPELSISFSIKDTDEVNRRLLAAAVKDARAKAEVIAEAAGAELGELCEITYGEPTGGCLSPTVYNSAAGGLSRGVDISIDPENAENMLNVTAVWCAVNTNPF